MAALRHAFRVFSREPLPACASVLVLALGIGATVAVFGVADRLLLRASPWPDADRIVYVEERRAGQAGRSAWTITNGTFHALSDESTTLQGVGAWMPSVRTLEFGEARDRVLTSAITPDLFDVLKPSPPVLGRALAEADARIGSPRVALLSHAYWEQRFGLDPSVIGTTIVLDARPYEVVGVMPESFAFPDADTRVWVPFEPLSLLSRDGRQIRVMMVGAIARLAPGRTVDEAATEATLRAQGVRDIRQAALSMFGARGGAVTVRLMPLPDVMAGDMRPVVLIASGAAVLLLIASVASIVGLRLARLLARRHEIAVQAALGARVWHLMRQWLAEGLILGACAGALALVVAHGMLRFLGTSLSDTIPGFAGAGLDSRSAAVSAAVTVAAGVICGLLPAILARRTVVAPAIGGLEERGTAGRREIVARTTIMTAQVTVACVLLVGGMLLTRSFVAMMAADRGYEPDGLLTARLTFPHEQSAPLRLAALEHLRERAEAMRGVRRVGISSGLPLVPDPHVFGRIVPTPDASRETLDIAATEHVVDEGVLDAMRLRLVAGRWLAASDTGSSAPVIVVNEAFAGRYLGPDAVGKRLELRLAGKPVWEIAGVVADVKSAALTASAAPEFYVSYRQAPSSVPEDPFVLLRTDGDPAAHIETLRALVAELGQNVAVDSVMAMDVRVRTSVARPRAYALVLATLAGFGILVVIAGFVGVLVYSMQQRVREIGVRIAVGARFADIMRLVVRQVIFATGAGLAGGTAIMLVVARLLSPALYGVAPNDAASFLTAGAVVAGAAVIACLAPAQRAARIDPVRALRSL